MAKGSQSSGVGGVGGMYSVQVTIHAAQGLKASDYLGSSDPYVAVKYGRLLVAKTHVKRKTLNPDWNQSFLFGPVSPTKRVAVEVWDCDPMGYDECLGCVLLNVENTAHSRRALPLSARPHKELKETGITGVLTLSYDIRPIVQEDVSHKGVMARTKAETIIDKTQSFIKRGPIPSKSSSSSDTKTASQVDLHQEIEMNNIANVLKHLTPENANLRNSHQETLIHKACTLGNIDLVKALLENKADINLQDRNGWTPLHCAASNNSLAICSLLVDHHSDVDALNRDGTSAVHYLVRNALQPNDKEAFSQLLKKFVENGSNLNCQNKNGESPLHQACMRGNIIATQVLLKHKAQSNILNSFGETPLSISCKQGLKDVVEILLKYGADPSSVSLNGLKEDIQELLKKQKEVGVGKAANKMSALRFMPLRCNGVLAPKGKGERSVLIEVQLGKEIKKCEAERVTSKHQSFKWVDVNMDFRLVGKESKIKIRLNDPKTNEALGYIGFNYADLPALKSGQGLHIGWHSLRKCAGQSEVSGKIWFGVCYLDSKGAPIGVDFARKAEMNSISVYGVLRGECAVDGCDCEVYQPGTSVGGPCFNCGHYPTKHSKKDQRKPTKTRKSTTRSTARSKSESEGKKSERKQTRTLKRDEGKESPKEASKEEINSMDAMLTASWAVDPKEITLIEPPLGEGTFAKVYKGKYRGQTVAVKVLKSKVGPKQLDEFQKEFAIMSAIRTPHVVFFYGACVNPTLYMVMEFCSRGTLFDVLKNEKDPIDWKLAHKLATDTVRGIWCLHSWKPQIVHRDLKSLNLLVDENFTVKVCDFGQSRFTEGAAKNASTLGKLRGTYHYCAPEVYFGQRYTTKADVFSIGVILWEIIYRTMTGEYLQPYADHKHLTFDFQIIIQTAKKGLRPTFPPNTPEHWIQVISLCWDADPTKRPECPQLLEALSELGKEFEADKEHWEGLRVEKKPEDVKAEEEAAAAAAAASQGNVGDRSDDSSEEDSSEEDSSDDDSDSSEEDSSDDDSESESDDDSGSDSESESESDDEGSSRSKAKEVQSDSDDSDSDSDSDDEFGSDKKKSSPPKKEEVVVRRPVVDENSDSDSSDSSDDEFGS